MPATSRASSPPTVMPDGHAEPGEGDAPAEDADGAPLDGAGVDVRDRWRGHRPRERPMISFMISFVPP